MKKFWKNQEKEIVIRGEKMNIFETIEKTARENPDKLALYFESDSGDVEKYTYEEMIKKVNKIANFLSKQGVREGSRVALFLPKCVEMYFGFLAVLKLGAIVMPLFEAFQEDGLSLRLDRGDVKFLITNKSLKKRVKKKVKVFCVDSFGFKRGVKKQSENCKTKLVNKMHTGMMIFTSSTAGTPVAGIELPHYGLVQQVFSGKKVLELGEKNYWCTAHPAWVTGAVYGLVVPFAVGASNYVLAGRFDSKSWLKFLKENKIESLYTAPTVLRLWKQDVKKSDFNNLKILASVGEALSEATFDFYKKKGMLIRDTFWQTETGAMIIANLSGKKGALGKPLEGLDVKIKDGEMVIKKPWPAMMTGIYKHKKMYNSYFSGGWFLTHDLAELKNGNFYFVGRKDDIIKTSGERVSPLEVENVLLKSKAVKESAVVGVPDKKRGSVIKAFVVLNEGFKGDEKLKKKLAEAVKKNYAGHAYPRIIEFVSDLPKGNSGKIKRMELRG